MAPQAPTLLVTEGSQRATLAAVRSLGAAGYRCIVTSASRRTLAGASRYAVAEEVIPDANGDPAGHALGIEALVAQHDIKLVLPMTEASALAALPRRENIDAVIPFPPLDGFRAICDKARVLEAAAAVGIRVPEQEVLRNPDAPLALPLPVVLKPTRSVVTASDGTRQKVGVRWAHSRDELHRALSSYPGDAYPILAQQVIRGPGIGVFVLLHDGRLLARFAHRRIREKPPSGGVSVVRHSEPMDEHLLEVSLALLDRFHWTGVAMVEYKRDVATGQHVLMEVNGRFWGSLQLAIDAGVDFPRLLVAAALGRPEPPVLDYSFARSRWFWGDTDHLIALWRDRRTSWRARTAGLGRWIRALGPGYRSEVFRLSDPRPFAVETARWLTDLGRR